MKQSRSGKEIRAGDLALPRVQRHFEEALCDGADYG